MKKLLSILLAVIMLALTLGTGAFAAEPEAGSLNVMTYNVSGIPVIGEFQGSQKEFLGSSRMAKIGAILNSESGCDIIGTQEDFNLHDSLAKAMPGYAYQTYTSGGVPLGDGVNIFSKFPLYNVKRTKWNSTFGIIAGSNDKLAQKGVCSSVIEIADGVYVDFYVLHADAGIDSKSLEARADNYRQLAAMINSRVYERAVIVVGDFNTFYARNLADDMYGNLIEPAGLKDCWAEIYNNGDCSYDNGVGWNPSYYESFDKVLFKSGGGVELNAKSLQYIQFANEQGQTYTDHIAAKAVISYAITGDTSTTEVMKAPEPFDPVQRQLDTAAAMVTTLRLLFTNLNEVVYLIGQGLDLLKQFI